jgi:hypothetical protein
MQARPRLRERDLHDLLGDAPILMSICSAVTFVVPRPEVHVAEVILVAEDVGQHGEAVAVLDQAHGDAGDVRERTPASISAR